MGFGLDGEKQRSRRLSLSKREGTALGGRTVTYCEDVEYVVTLVVTTAPALRFGKLGVSPGLGYSALADAAASSSTAPSRHSFASCMAAGLAASAGSGCAQLPALLYRASGRCDATMFPACTALALYDQQRACYHWLGVSNEETFSG